MPGFERAGDMRVIQRALVDLGEGVRAVRPSSFAAETKDEPHHPDVGSTNRSELATSGSCVYRR